MPPHGHGDEEEEVVAVRTDGPPFFDIRAKQGKGFECDFDKAQKFLGPGKISQVDFNRDVAAVNAVYIPTAHKSGYYLRIASNLLLGSFTVFIIMGILGEFAGSARSTVIALCVVAFLLGMAAFMYSKWIEQPGIRLGADAVKKLLDEKINPRYGRSEFKLRWSVAVRVQRKKAIHAGRAFMERPVLTLWALRSANADGVVVDWPVPEALLSRVFVEDSDIKVVGVDGSK